MHEHDDSGMAQAMSESANCADLHQHGNDTPARAAAACSGQPDCWAWVPRSTRPRRRSPTKNPTGTRDSQYLFDEDRGDSRPLEASLRWILDHTGDENIAFLTHLGDLTQNGLADEFAAIGPAPPTAC